MTEKEWAELAARVRTVKPKRKRLDELTDELNARIDDCEAAIVALHLGVAGEVVVKVTEAGTEQRLGWHRIDSAWRLTFCYGDGEQPQRLRTASRAARLLCVPHLPRLLSTLVEQVENEIGDVITAHGQVVAFLDDMKKANT